ncbi:hypothetical protein PSEUBRA_006379 [Kalmanozyma brasiliensis GHG001]|uniref:uncharacterized protein n=1 Tax=Kalmanozyma brasiliensis (strain GHG001) TaxID=1365824 RepID=UPI002867D939|nr:uncharacterized protein PSEUBRA_006379 [Kalmanozyma brasiliensis GHG001]KAF6767672.1 hypothetical protein PSEUBRA_006379 [Kalmanozyma brasiliensis GHG001]
MAACAAIPMQLLRRTGSSVSEESAVVDAARARLVSGAPPHWFPNYAPFAVLKVPALFRGNQIHVDRLQPFRDRLETYETVRSSILQNNHAELIDAEKQLFLKPFNVQHWRDFQVTEENPHNIHRATLLFQQDKLQMENMDAVIARLLRRVRWWGL